MAGSPGREVEYRNPLAQELLPLYQLGGASPPAASLEPYAGSANAGGSARKLTYAQQQQRRQQAQPPPPQQQQPDNNRPNQGGTELLASAALP